MSEWSLLCRLTTPADQHEAVEWPETVDWERLIGLADGHGVLHHLGERLSAVERVPDELQDQLRARRRERVAHSLTLANGLHSVHEQFRDASIPALPYKGPVLSAGAPGAIAARQYVDLDIVVAPEAFDRACGLLRASDYEQVERLRALGEVALRNKDSVVVDLHRSALPRYFPATLPVESLWSRRRHVEVGGTSLPSFDPVDRFVVLAVHGAKHRWYKLAWAHDVATLLVRDETDWTEVVTRARSLGALRHVRLACWLANHHFGVTTPDAISVAADPVAADLGAELVEQFEPSATPPTDRAQFRYQWRALARRRDRVRYATRLATLPSERDIQNVPLPAFATPLYRVVRPVRLLGRYGRAAVSRLLTGP